MKALDAAEIILGEAEEPLHYREIVRQILQRGLWVTEGKTPERTINALLVTDIKNKGDASRFLHMGRAVFGLRPSGMTKDREAPSFDKVSLSDNGNQVRTRTMKETLSFTDAAERVLEQLGNKRPMHYRDITKEALRSGLITTEGKTPESTMYAQILTEIDRDMRRGKPPRFVKHGRGLVSLARWTGMGLRAQIVQHNATVRNALHHRLLIMSPDDFEVLLGTLLGLLGFAEVTVTNKSGDGGIDVRGTLVVGDVIRTRMAVQAKRWKHNVQKPIVQQVRGSLGAHDQGLIITTSDFSIGARDEAERSDATPVALMNGDQLVSLLVEHGIGINRSTYELIELAESGDPEAI